MPAAPPRASLDKEATSVDAERGVKSGSVIAFDPKEQKRVLRKLDIKLLPFVSLLYLLSFLCVHNAVSIRHFPLMLFCRDRSNIGTSTRSVSTSIP